MRVRILFAILLGAAVFLLLGVSNAVFDVSAAGLLIAAVAGALAAAGGYRAWPWVEGKSGFAKAVAAGLGEDEGEGEGEGDDWRDDGSGERAGWDAHHIRGLSPHNAWIVAPDELGFGPADTAEMPAVKPAVVVDEPTVVYDLRGFSFRRRPPGRRRATKVAAK